MARLPFAVPIVALLAGVAAAGPPPGAKPQGFNLVVGGGGGRAPLSMPTSPFGAGRPAASPAAGGGGWGNALSIAGAALAASGGGHPPQAHKYVGGGGGFANPNTAAAVGQILGAIGQASAAPQGYRYQAGSGGGLGNAMADQSVAPQSFRYQAGGAGGAGNALAGGTPFGGWTAPTTSAYTPVYQPAYTPVQPVYTPVASTPTYIPAQPTYPAPTYTPYPTVVGGSGGVSNPYPAAPTSPVGTGGGLANPVGSYPTVVGSGGGVASPIPGPQGFPNGTLAAGPPYQLGPVPAQGSPFAGTPSPVSIPTADPPPPPPPVEQWHRNRFVKLRNQSGQPLTFHVRYHKLTQTGGLWLPGEGHLPPVRLLPGEEAYLTHAGYRVTADKLRFTVVTDDGTKFAKYNTRDYVLGGPAERDANGDLRYWAARVGTYTYTVTPPAKRS